MIDEQQPVAFQFSGLRFRLVYILAVITPLEVFLLIEAILGGGSAIWFLFLLGILLFYVLIPYLLIRADSDVIVDNEHISRRFVGQTIQSLSWSNIQEVTVVRAPNRDHPNRVAINFMPKVVPRRSFTRTGRIVFATDPLRTGTLSELLNIINQQITQHGIKVAWWVNGIKTYTDHVEWPLPQLRGTERSRAW